MLRTTRLTLTLTWLLAAALGAGLVGCQDDDPQGGAGAANNAANNIANNDPPQPDASDDDNNDQNNDQNNTPNNDQNNDPPPDAQDMTDVDDTPDAQVDVDEPHQDIMEDADEVPDGDDGMPDVMDMPDVDEPDVDEPDVPDEGDPFEGRPTGQCTQNSDCPDNALGPGQCSRALPGGACMGCGMDDHCPSGTICQFGTCITECDTTDDCPPGLTCNSRNLCAAQRCQDDACPVPLFSCSGSGQCERGTCNTDDECPDQTSCVSGRCIEDRTR